MEMHQLRYFLAVARGGNFSRAARECHVSQPSLSQQILKLEDEVGEPLFLREPRGASLTAAGAAFLPHAERVLSEVDAAASAVRESAGRVRGRLALGVLPTIAPFLLPRWLGPFLRAHPEVELVVQEETTPRLLEALERGELDVALLSLPTPGAEGLERRLLFAEPLLLVLPARHPLARRERVPMAALAQEKFILMQEGHCLADQALEFCHARGDFSPHILCRSAQVQTLLALVEAGLGLSLVPEMAARPRKGVTYRRLAGVGPERKIAFVWRRHRLWPAARALVEWASAQGGASHPA